MSDKSWEPGTFLIFLAGNQLYELKCNRRGWCGCCCWGPKKIIDIFTYKQRLLSINMKTKVVQHVKSERLKECESVRVWECESVRLFIGWEREREGERLIYLEIIKICLSTENFNIRYQVQADYRAAQRPQYLSGKYWLCGVITEIEVIVTKKDVEILFYLLAISPLYLTLTER